MRALVLLAAIGCQSAPPLDDSLPPWADEVLEAPGHTGEGTRDAGRAVNGARGGGPRRGGLDVFSLGLERGVDDILVVGWSDRALVDGPGVDLVVFENPFDVSEGYRFLDPVVVEVSADGERFVAFPHAYLADDPSAWSGDAADWQGFAGLEPVLLHEEDNPVDPFDPEAAGGDGFDLADLPADDPLTEEILARGVRAVRLTSAAALDDPQTGLAWPRDPVSDGADIDAVYGRWLEPR